MTELADATRAPTTMRRANGVAAARTADEADRLEPALSAAAKALRSAASVVVCGHVDPDGDAIGSALALTAGLRSLGIDAVATWGARDETTPPPTVPAAWRPLLPAMEAVRAPDDLPATADVLLVADCGAASRLGTLQTVLDRVRAVVVLDHHAVGEPFGDVRAVDATASSTGVLALRLLDLLGCEVDARIANALYLAIMTDTGRFAYPATTPTDHLVAARLLEAGADHAALAQAVYEQASMGFLQLVSRVTGGAAVSDRVLVAAVSQHDLADSGAQEGEVDGLLGILRQVEGVDVTCLLRETPDGRWRTSLRSGGDVDVAAAAARLGGGGHRLAAGCVVAGPLAGARSAVLDAVAAVAAAPRGDEEEQR